MSPERKIQTQLHITSHPAVSPAKTLLNPSEVSLQTARCYFNARRRSQVQQRNIDLFIPPSHSRIFTTTPAERLSRLALAPAEIQFGHRRRELLLNGMARCQRDIDTLLLLRRAAAAPVTASSSEAPRRSFW